MTSDLRIDIVVIMQLNVSSQTKCRRDVINDMKLRIRGLSVMGRRCGVIRRACRSDGCAVAALSADVSRAQPAVKDAYERKMTAPVNRSSRNSVTSAANSLACWNRNPCAASG